MQTEKGGSARAWCVATSDIIEEAMELAYLVMICSTPTLRNGHAVCTVSSRPPRTVYHSDRP